MEATSEKAGDVTVLVPAGKILDQSNSRAFIRNVTGQVAPGARVVLDMSPIQYINSDGCGAIVTIFRHLRSGSDGDMKLCGLTPPVRMVLELVRIHNLMDIFNTRAEALKAYQV